ncbi:MAG: hypothetical protein Q6373_022970, partial [Candidatus Sigynarchaeota archaeon]
FITMRNLECEPETRKITLDEEIGLKPTSLPIVVRQFHPTERIIGEFPYGATVEIEMLAFRSCLVIAAAKDAPVNKQEVTITGTDYEVVRDIPGKHVKVTLLGMPGTTARVSLPGGKTMDVQFPGQSLKQPWHRKLAELDPCDVPADAETLYEATCFAADNNCLEARCMARSGSTLVPEVQAARDAFFEQPLFKARAPWDKFVFDSDASTRMFTAAYPEAGLRIDLGDVVQIDALIIKGTGDGFEKDSITVDISTDLITWTTVSARVHDCRPALASDKDDSLFAITPEPEDAPFDPRNDPRFFGESRFPLPVGKQRYVEIDVPGKSARYFRVHDVPAYVFKVGGRNAGAWIHDRSRWRLNYLFERLQRPSFDKAYHASFLLDEIPDGSQVCVAIFGEHGDEGAFAALRIDGKPIGAPDRALSYQAHPWEHVVKAATGNYTYYFPLRQEYKGKPIEAFVLGVKGNPRPMFVEAWITAYPIPFKRVELDLEDHDPI